MGVLIFYYAIIEISMLKGVVFLM